MSDTESIRSDYSAPRKSSKKTSSDTITTSRLLTYGIVGISFISAAILILYLYKQSKQDKKENVPQQTAEATLMHTDDRIDTLSREVGQLRSFISDYLQPQPYAPQFYEEAADVQSPPEDDRESVASSSSSSSSSSSRSSAPSEQEEPPRCTVRLQHGKRSGELCGKKCPPGSTICKRHAAHLKVKEESSS